MNIKIKNSGSMLSMLNGKPVLHKDYIVDVDSNREKGKKIIGLFNDNGKVNTIGEDTLQGYMKKMSFKNQSLFDILKQEHGTVNNLLTIPKKMVMPKKLMSSKSKSKSKEKTKKRDLVHNGISSKIFNFTNLNTFANPETAPNPETRVLQTMLTRKKRRRKQSRKRRNKKLF